MVVFRRWHPLGRHQELFAGRLRPVEASSDARQIEQVRGPGPLRVVAGAAHADEVGTRMPGLVREKKRRLRKQVAVTEPVREWTKVNGRDAGRGRDTGENRIAVAHDKDLDRGRAHVVPQCLLHESTLRKQAGHFGWPNVPGRRHGTSTVARCWIDFASTTVAGDACTR